MHLEREKQYTRYHGIGYCVFNECGDNTMRILRLLETIENDVFVYRLITRTERVAIYQQFYKDVPKCFEVFKIKTEKAFRNRFRSKWENDFDEKEYFPTDAAFGKTAWTYKTLDEAEKKYRKLICHEGTLQVE